MYKICDICGKRYAEEKHHLVFGTASRKLADQDNLVLFICGSCHNKGKINERIHDNVMAEHLSKMLGQMMFERDYIAKSDEVKMEAREAFRKRYGKSFL